MNQRKLPFVWELRYNGTISHAVGTHHSVPDIPDIYAEDAARYVEGKKQLLMECDILKKPEGDLARLLDTQLSEVTGKADHKDLVTLACILEQPMFLLTSMRVLALDDALLKKCTSSKLKAVDFVMQEQALKYGVAINYLEKNEEHVPDLKAAIRRVPERVQEIATQERLEPGSWKKEYRQDLDAYMSGDLQAIIELSKKEEINTDRHKTIAERSLPYLKEPSTIAVGLAHFVVEPTVLTFYRQKGIEVKRVQ